MNSDERNKAIRDLDLEFQTKPIFYWGWWWRDVDFDKPFVLATDGRLTGFCQNNKWGYPEFIPTEQQREELIALIDKALSNYNLRDFKAVETYMQRLGKEQK